jgi:hypothetical protein
VVIDASYARLKTEYHLPWHGEARAPPKSGETGGNLGEAVRDPAAEVVESGADPGE